MPIIDINSVPGAVQNSSQGSPIPAVLPTLTAPQNYSPQQQIQQPIVDLAQNLDQKIQNNVNAMQQMQLQPLNLNQASTNPQVTQQGMIQEQQLSLAQILQIAIQRDASDVHLTSGYRAMLRVDGDLVSLPSIIQSPEMLSSYASEMIKQRKDLSLNNAMQVDLGFDFGGRRFRVNIFKEMSNFAIVMRLIPQEIKTIDSLNLPQIFHDFTKVPAGLILVTGPTGSGKSTTLASIINEINLSQKKHIITIEDPIEFIYPTGQSIVEQRELGQDFENFPSALKALLRQDPNVVLVGEMRDYETVSSAVTVSETGHLVFATLHTNSASQSIDRIIDVFPEAQQSQIRSQLANVLTAVVSQRLVKLANGKRKAVHEILIATPAVKNAIREDKTYQIDNMIQTGVEIGMVSMENSLVELVQKGDITREAAMSVTVKPKELEILLNK